MDTLLGMMALCTAIIAVVLLIVLVGLYAIWHVMAVAIPVGFIVLGVRIGGTAGAVLVVVGVVFALIGWRETLRSVRNQDGVVRCQFK